MDKHVINKTTFWNYLQANNIVIPIVQRDYAQGRDGKEYLRHKFLMSLKEALDTKKTLQLDFVYGSEEHGRVFPLDGQQRLTTLWLMHWYIAYKSGNLEDNRDTFMKFTYETRVTSRVFMERLCELEPRNESTGKLDGFIKSHTWFLSSWLTDPTIKAMLTLISGNERKGKDGKDIVDGMDELFIKEDGSDYSNNYYNELWEILTSKDCPIVFYNLKLGKDNLPLTDDLYVKMNARGKPLTGFENFKADLVNFIREEYDQHDDSPYSVEISSKLDNAWLDVFWNLQSRYNDSVDEIYFTFIKRFLVSSMILTKNEGTYCYKAEDVGKNRLYSADSELPYEDFSIYKNLLSKDVLGELDDVLDFCKNKAINELTAPYWVDETVGTSVFLPTYDKQGKVSKLDMRSRIVFSAVCMYIRNMKRQNESYDEERFKDWLHFTWNMTENSPVDNAEQMISIIRFLNDDYSSNSHNIIGHLAMRSPMNETDDKDTARIRQLNEEIIKARKINENTTWKIKINDAENTAFFHGTVRFLYTGAKGEENWDKFEDKFLTAKELFDQDGVKEEYRNNSLLLCHFISLFDSWNQIRTFYSVSFSNAASEWKKLLNMKRLRNVVDKLLTTPIEEIQVHEGFKSTLVNDLEEGKYESVDKRIQEDLTNNTLMNNIIEYMGQKGLLHWTYGHYVIYKPNAKADWGKYVVGDIRNRILSEAEKVDGFTVEQKIGDSGLYWGWNIPFTYNGKKFNWQSNLKIVSQDATGDKKYFEQPSDLSELESICKG